MTLELHETASERLRDTGQRYTTQRRRLVELLARAGSPRSIPEILRGRTDLKQSSVYRNLAVLEQAKGITAGTSSRRTSPATITT
jgi:Fur family transcriptional regulator, ferric uptake regulator